MATGILSVTLQIGGETIQKTVVRTGDSVGAVTATIPYGFTVTSWVKTDANTAACNLPSGHGYSNGNFDVFWTESGVQKVRYGVAGTISTNALSLDGGTGDDFPATATSGVVVCRQVTVNVTLDGDNLSLAGMCMEYTDSTATSVGHLTFKDAASDEIFAKTTVANVPYPFDITGGQSNPMTGDVIANCYATNGSTTANATLKILQLGDSTP